MNPGQKPEERKQLEEFVEEGRRGIEQSAAYTRPWPEPASPYELAKAAVEKALPLIVRSLSTQPEEGPREGDTWCCDSCGAISPIEQALKAGWEQEGPDDAGVTVERCPACRLRPDCQEAGEGLVERLREKAEELDPRDPSTLEEPSCDEERGVGSLLHAAATGLVELERSEVEAARNALEMVDHDAKVQERGRESMEKLDRPDETCNKAWAKLRAALPTQPEKRREVMRVASAEVRSGNPYTNRAGETGDRCPECGSELFDGDPEGQPVLICPKCGPPFPDCQPNQEVEGLDSAVLRGAVEAALTAHIRAERGLSEALDAGCDLSELPTSVDSAVTAAATYIESSLGVGAGEERGADVERLFIGWNPDGGRPWILDPGRDFVTAPGVREFVPADSNADRVARADLLDAMAEVMAEVARSPGTSWAFSLWDRLFHGENFHDIHAALDKDGEQ